MDIQSIRNLSLTSKNNYSNYLINKVYLDKQNIKNIFSYFNLEYSYLIKPINNLTDSELFYINYQLNQIYNKYYKNQYCSIAAFLKFLITHPLKNESSILFETFISICKFKYHITLHENRRINIDDFNLELNDYSFNQRYVINISDCKYILKHSNNIYLDIILNWYKIPATILSFIVKDILYNQSINKIQNMDKKITKIIDYLLYNYCSFDFTNDIMIHFNSIINDIITYKKTSLFMYILTCKKEYGFTLNYQTLVNKCLDIQNIQILKLLITEIKNENKTNNRKIQITICPEMIGKICEKGCFKFLNFIISNMLGGLINASKYILFICDGITSYSIREKTIKLDEIEWIYNYLSDENKILLQSSIYSLK